MTDVQLFSLSASGSFVGSCLCLVLFLLALLSDRQTAEETPWILGVGEVSDGDFARQYYGADAVSGDCSSFCGCQKSFLVTEGGKESRDARSWNASSIGNAKMTSLRARWNACKWLDIRGLTIDSNN